MIRFLDFIILSSLCVSCTDIYYSVGTSSVGFACNKITEKINRFSARVETISYCAEPKECEKVCNALRAKDGRR